MINNKKKFSPKIMTENFDVKPVRHCELPTTHDPHRQTNKESGESFDCRRESEELDWTVKPQNTGGQTSPLAPS